MAAGLDQDIDVSGAVTGIGWIDNGDTGKVNVVIGGQTSDGVLISDNNWIYQLF